MTLKAIGERLQKDQTTISKEVKRRIKVHTNSVVKRELLPKTPKSPFCMQRMLKKEPELLLLFYNENTIMANHEDF